MLSLIYGTSRAARTGSLVRIHSAVIKEKFMSHFTRPRSLNLKTRAAALMRAALAAAALAVTLGAGLAAAGGPAGKPEPVSSPTGTTLCGGAPVLVQWTPAYWPSSTVNIGLYRVSPVPKLYFGSLAAQVNNTGEARVELPHSFKCDPSYIYQVTVGTGVNNVEIDRASAYFKFNCACPSLTVVKKVINNTGIPIPDNPFLVDINCGGNGPSTTLLLSGANKFKDSVTSIEPGKTCTIKEQAPKAPEGCQWVTTYPKGKSVVIKNAENMREVRNRLSCEKTGSNPGDGSLTIVKTVVINSTVTPPTAPFLVQVDCTNFGPSALLSLSGFNSFTQTVSNIPVDSVCSISEQAPLVPAGLTQQGCKWTTTYPDGQLAAMPGQAAHLTRTVLNTWVCNSGNTSVTIPGSLTILKEIINNSKIIPPTAPFQVQVACSPSGPNTSVSLSDANNFKQTVPNIGVNSVCTLTEQAPFVPANMADHGCKWTTTYPDGQTASMPKPALALTRTVLNSWTCDGGTGPGTVPGSLTILKEVVINSTITPPTAPFKVLVACNNSGLNNLVSLSNANSFTQTVYNIPANSACTITELPPSVPAALANQNCKWTTAYPAGQNAVMPNPAIALNRTVLNTWDCPQTPVVLCADPAHVPAYNNGSTSANNVPIGQCYKNNVNECRYNWRTPATYNDGQGWNNSCPSATAGAACCGWKTPPVPVTGSLTVTKTVVNNTAGPAPTAPFLVQVACSNGGPNTQVSLSNANSFTQTVSSIPANSACTITEQAPTVTAAQTALGCKWTTAYPAGQNAVMPNPAIALNRTVLNTWSCDGSTGTGTGGGAGPGTGTGSLTIIKTVVSHSAINPPADPFLVQVNCSTSGPNVQLSLSNTNSFTQTVSNIPANAVCTLTEQAPVVTAALKKQGCAWTASYPGGQTATFPALAAKSLKPVPGGQKNAAPGPATSITRTVLNTWTCDESPETGTITVTKKIRNKTHTPTPVTPFQVKLDCKPGGLHQILPLTSPDKLQQTVVVPLKSVCFISELPPVAPKSCHWETSYPNDQEGGIGTKFVIENELLCDETGTLTVTKKVRDLLSTEQAPDPTGGFQVTVACKNGFSKVLRLGRDDSETISGLPIGTSCTVSEALPLNPQFSAPLSCPAGSGMHTGASGVAGGGTGAMTAVSSMPAIWNTASYSPAPTVIIAPGANAIKVNNTYKCSHTNPS